MSIRTLSNHIFDTREEAMEWLLKQPKETIFKIYYYPKHWMYTLVANKIEIVVLESYWDGQGYVESMGR